MRSTLANRHRSNKQAATNLNLFSILWPGQLQVSGKTGDERQSEVAGLSLVTILDILDMQEVSSCRGGMRTTSPIGVTLLILSQAGLGKSPAGPH